MRFPCYALLFASLAAITIAHTAEDGSLSARELDDFVLDAREVFDDLGLHSRALDAIELSERRIEELEERMADLEDELEARAPPKKKAVSKRGGGKRPGLGAGPPQRPAETYDCPWDDCDFIGNSPAEVTAHLAGSHGGRQPPPSRRRKPRRK